MQDGGALISISSLTLLTQPNPVPCMEGRCSQTEVYNTYNELFYNNNYVELILTVCYYLRGDAEGAPL